MLEYIGLTLLMPFLAALCVALLLRCRLHPLAVLGLGHAASVVATVARGLMGVSAIRRLGLFDPFLAMALVSAGLILLSRWVARTWTQWRTRRT